MPCVRAYSVNESQNRIRGRSSSDELLDGDAAAVPELRRLVGVQNPKRVSLITVVFLPFSVPLLFLLGVLASARTAVLSRSVPP